MFLLLIRILVERGWRIFPYIWINILLWVVGRKGRKCSYMPVYNIYYIWESIYLAERWGAYVGVYIWESISCGGGRKGRLQFQLSPLHLQMSFALKIRRFAKLHNIFTIFAESVNNCCIILHNICQMFSHLQIWHFHPKPSDLQIWANFRTQYLLRFW